MKENAPRSTPLCRVIPRQVSCSHVDLSPESDLFDGGEADATSAPTAGITSCLGDRSGHIGVVKHLSPVFMMGDRRQPNEAEPETLLIGTGLLVREGEEVCTPEAARVVALAEDGALVLEHAGPEASATTWSVWRGVTPAVPVGSELSAGAPLGTCSRTSSGLGLGGFVQVQLIKDRALVDAGRRFGRPSDRSQLVDSYPDPATFLGVPTGSGQAEHLTAPEVVALRDERLARSQRAYYENPPRLVRGRGVWLYDEDGLAYLDSMNNVTHVGHCEPRVIDAATQQLRRLNTNSRFIYEGMATYADRLVSLLPAPLEVVFLVCTGSEANDLALRISRQVTGRDDVVVLDGAYHGNTSAVMGISPNRYKGPGGRGAPPTTHEVVTPDVYRGPYGRNDDQAGAKYGADAARVIEGLVERGRPPAAFIAESLMGTAGNIVFPQGFLPTAFDAARKAGAICISDEVQVGVGRLGTHFWGFQAQGVIPDIVTMGKPLGNGHPIAAVATTRAIADAFDDGVKYFNTFAGNPVSCAIGHAVLDVVEEDGLQARAFDVGTYMLDRLAGLMTEHELIGDVRGHGLYLGIELVRDRETKEPAAAEAMRLSERLKDQGILTYPTGINNNVLKIKPPMVFERRHVDLYCEVLDATLSRHPQG